MNEVTTEKDFNLLFLGINDSELINLLYEGFLAYSKNADLRRSFEDDLHLLRADGKLFRLLDREDKFRDEQTLLELVEADLDPMKLKLKTGRPGMPPAALYAFYLLNGARGSFENASLHSDLSNHAGLQEIFLRLGLKKFPCGRSIMQNIAAISPKSISLIFRSQVDECKAQEIEDFLTATCDSTFVKANSKWPTDSSLLAGLIEKGHKLGQRVSEFSDHRLPNFGQWHLERWIKEMKNLDKEINLSTGKKNAKKVRQKNYPRLYAIAEKAAGYLNKQFDEREHLFNNTAFTPSRKRSLEKFFSEVENTLCMAYEVLLYSSARVLHDEKIPACEKVYSISDSGAYMIEKGQRTSVVGYRPTVFRTKSGILTPVFLEKGNPNDTAIFTSALDAYIEQTSVIPQDLCTDAGYASLENYKDALRKGVKNCCFSGSNGKKYLGEEKYNSEAITELRNWRSAGESTYSVLKGSYNFDRMARRGLSSVRAEMNSKLCAFNFTRMYHIKNDRECLLAEAS